MPSFKYHTQSKFLNSLNTLNQEYSEFNNKLYWNVTKIVEF